MSRRMVFLDDTGSRPGTAFAKLNGRVMLVADEAWDDNGEFYQCIPLDPDGIEASLLPVRCLHGVKDLEEKPCP